MQISDIKVGDKVRNKISRNVGIVTGIPDHFFLCHPWVWVRVMRKGANSYNCAWTVRNLVKVR